MIPNVIQPFPTDPAERKAKFAAMQAAAPELVADIAALRADFPKLRITYFQAPGIELGEVPRTDGWKVDDNLIRAAAAWRRRFALPPEVAEQKRKDKKRSSAVRRTRNKA